MLKDIRIDDKYRQERDLAAGLHTAGVFAMWYGKGPGVDRCGDVFAGVNIVRKLIKNLRADNHELACEIADVPDRVRGFGLVKQRNARTARERRLELMSDWSRQAGVPPTSNIQP